VNLCDYDKRTALHLAAAEGNTEIMELLCHYDAALLFDLNGETAFNDAIRADSMDAIEVLK
jgi:ankyrin repeat protein